MSVDDDERSGRPSTSTAQKNIANVREVILADRRQTIHDVYEVVRLSYGTVQRILADNLNMRRISARLVPKVLSDDQKAHRASLCRELNPLNPELNPICYLLTLLGADDFLHVSRIRVKLLTLGY